jgi:hypothetical protein
MLQSISLHRRFPAVLDGDGDGDGGNADALDYHKHPPAPANRDSTIIDRRGIDFGRRPTLSLPRDAGHPAVGY